MSDVSTIPAVQDALAEALRARPALTDPAGPFTGPVPVDVGWPGDGPRKPYHVWIEGTVDEWDQEYETTPQDDGSGVLAETYTVTVNVLATRAGNPGAPSGGYRTVRDDAFALAAEIPGVLRDDLTLGGTCDRARTAGGHVSEGTLPDGDRQVLVELRVRVRAQVSG